MHVLMIEDNPVLGRTLKKAVEEAGWQVDLAADGEAGLALAAKGHYDIIVLDWMLPKVSGLDLLKQLRQQAIDIPIIMMTARGALQDRVEGLEQGADDYIVKPFELVELIARLNALFRRSIGRGSRQIRIGRLTLDMAAQTLNRDGQALELTGKEFDLLVALAARRGQLVKRSDLLSLLYQINDEPESNSMDVLVARVRRKLSGSAVEIATIRGKGFLLRVVEEHSPQC